MPLPSETVDFLLYCDFVLQADEQYELVLNKETYICRTKDKEWETLTVDNLINGLADISSVKDIYDLFVCKRRAMIIDQVLLDLHNDNS